MGHLRLDGNGQHMSKVIGEQAVEEVDSALLTGGCMRRKLRIVAALAFWPSNEIKGVRLDHLL